MKIILLSFTDSTNFGDQFIVEQLEKRLKKYGKVITYSYNFRKNFSPIEFTSYIEKSWLNSLKSNLKNKLQKFSIVDKINSKRIVKQLESRIANSSFIEDLKKSDILIFGGGNVIFDLTRFGDSAGKFEVIINAAKKYNKKIIFMDVGIGPFATKKQVIKTREVLKLADYITVRDQGSYNLISDLKNVELGIDPVFSLKKQFCNDKKNPIPCIGICIIDYTLNKATKSDYYKYLQDTRKLILKIKVAHPESQIIVFNSEIRDFDAVPILKKILSDCKLNIEYMFVGSKKQLIDLYKDLDIIIGTRMHSMIVAISQDIPVIGISWQPKVSEIFKIIDNENSVFDIKTFGEKTDEIIAILNKQLAIVEKSNFGFAQEIIEEKTQIDFRLLNKVAEELNNE